MEGLRCTHFLLKVPLVPSQESNSFFYAHLVSHCIFFCNKIEINILLS